MARAFRLASPRVPEAALHTQIASAFRLEIAPAGRVSPQGVCWFSIDIAAYSGVAPGLRTSRGVVAGIPDMVVLYEGRAYWIEVKAADGILSEAQRTVAVAILTADCGYGIARDMAEAIQLLDSWRIPRQHRVTITPLVG